MLHPSPDIGLFGRRQRHVRGHRIPVNIVSKGGVAASDRDTAVVADDLDADETLLPEIGCQCCTVRVKLQDAVRRLLAERAQRPFSRVVMATEQDIVPIMRTFATERALGAEFHVESAPPLAGNTFTLTEDTPLSWETFSRFIATLMALRGADVLRVNGLLNIVGCRGPVAVQCMQHLAMPPVELQAWADENRVTRLEFITRGIEEKIVQNLFDSIRSLQTSS